MDIFSLPSTPHCCCYSSSLLSPSVLTPKPHITTAFALSVKSSPESDNPTSTSSFPCDIRRPIITHKQLKSSPTASDSPKPKKIPRNPLKTLADSDNSSINSPQSLTDKLWLTRKLSPPPPPPPPPILKRVPSKEKETRVSKNSLADETPRVEFRQEGKIFVGNLPLWIKKNDLAEFFRQFGPIQNVIVVKGHDDIEKNMGFGFVIYGGSKAAESAMKAVEFDGVEFHGRVLTVKLDDGRRIKARSEERARWVEGDDSVDYRSKWHEEREGSRGEFRKVIESQPENWQAVVRAFERIKKARGHASCT